MHDDTLPSKSQQGWEELMEDIRRHLGTVAALIPAMKPDELAKFMESVREAYWMELGAQTFDKRCEIEHQKSAFTS